ncbi:MAG: hypothetical protein IPM68_09615 [Flavobacteriales bacterium]|nr:hypothetical protein [Flavobacteriales bacterium]
MLGDELTAVVYGLVSDSRIELTSRYIEPFDRYSLLALAAVPPPFAACGLVADPWSRLAREEPQA